MSALVALPIVVPLLTAILCLLAWRSRRWQRLLNVAGSAALLGVGVALLWHVSAHGVQVVFSGGWPAPFGITLVADLLAAIMVLLAAVTGVAVAVYALGSIDERREAYGFHALYQVLLMGVCGAFLTGDLFNLYVCFEVMLMASFVLLALGGEREQLEGGVKYVTLNLLSSALFLAAVGAIYGVTGTLNMAQLAELVAQGETHSLLPALAVLFFAAFGIKAALFPFFFWLPASYHTPPIAVSAIFAGLLTKVGVYALLRTFTLIFTGDAEFTRTLLLVIAALTMTTGVLGAASQMEYRRVLSFHIISQIGYMVMGLALKTALGLTGAVFYLMHHIVVKTNLFLIGGIVRRFGGSYDLKRLGGIYRSKPWLALAFLVPAFSLAGIPPLSGFWGKLVVIKAGLDAGAYVVTAVALVVGFMTLYSMVKLWNEAFWKAPPDARPSDAGARRVPLVLLVPVLGLAVLTVAIGLGAGPAFDLAARAAAQLADPSTYVAAVLDPTRSP
jgi:multicomponent Na+:H+ antiporter subunit D